MLAGVFLVFVITLFIGVPIGVSLIFSALCASIINPSLTANAMFIYRTMVTGLDSYVLLAIPLFILSGNIMAKGGISNRLFNFFSYFVGNKTAGLPIAVIISCLFYGAITGSGPATVAAIGAMTIPIMIESGYEKMFSVALVTVAGGLGVIIPPSILFVAYGLASGASVGSLFIAGFIPGIIIGLCLIIYAYIYCKKKGEDKEKLNAKHAVLKEKGFLPLFKETFWALLAPVIILGGIYTGIVTPTEAADISVIYALFVSIFIYKSIKPKDLIPIFSSTIKSLVPLLFVCAGATVFARVLTLMQAPQQIAALITNSISSTVIIILIMNLFLLVIGMIMDAISAILIITPIFLPIALNIGIDPIHLGIIMSVNLAIGFVTPPVGVNLYVGSSLAKVPVLALAKKCLPLIFWFLIALGLITFIPKISLILL